MNPIKMLNAIQQQYLKGLYQFVESATFDEINQFTNYIHDGKTKENCGLWSTASNTFTACNHPNCRELSDCLRNVSLSTRPELLSFHFDGNSEKEKNKQKKEHIAQQYIAQLPDNLSEDELNAISANYLNIEHNHWETLEDFVELMNKVS
ncbi:hypothetical protein [Photobacterium indicum]|uniref:hypothetical protein n=1 Tax=Photobacterium indicum TaxID=81447 RepID=UPI003D10BE17